MNYKSFDGRKRMGYFNLEAFLVFLMFTACVPRSNHPFIEEGQANHTEVLEYLNDVLRSDPDNQKALYQKAKIQADQEEWQSALVTIDRALKIDFANNDYFFLKGKIMAALQYYNESVKAFQRSEVLGNSSHELYKHLSRSYLELGEPKLSREVVNRLLKLDNGDEAHVLAAETLLALNDSSEAVRQFNKALKRNEENKKALTGLKNIYLSQGMVTEAESLLDQLLSIEGDRQDLLLDKIDLLALQDQLDTAKYLLGQMLEYDSSKLVVSKMAELHYQLANFDSALFYLSKMDTIKETNLLFLQARALDKSRSFTLAEAVYERIVASDSTNEIALNELATLRGKMSYLQRKARERATLDSVRNTPPSVLNRREIVN
ncbi:MAG: tetratricopeptide repeat protein [Bacteroidota bacterium]